MRDLQCHMDVQDDVSNAVAWYLAAAWVYDEALPPLLSDPAYDALCQLLDHRWDDITDHRQSCIDRMSLKTGTTMGIPYPSNIYDVVEELRGSP
jgi:hypothetical protein